jgi:hypothetical protein
MNFTDYMIEELVASKYMRSPVGAPIWVEMFKNPTRAELQRALVSDDEGADQRPAVRGLIMKNGDIYIWNFNVFHKDVIKDYFKESDIAFRFDWEKGYDYLTQISPISTPAYSMLNDKVQDKIVNSLAQMFGDSARYVIFPDTMPGAKVPDQTKIDLKSVKVPV